MKGGIIRQVVGCIFWVVLVVVLQDEVLGMQAVDQAVVQYYGE